MPSSADTAWIVAQAKQLGFDLCGIAPLSNPRVGVPPEVPPDTPNDLPINVPIDLPIDVPIGVLINVPRNDGSAGVQSATLEEPPELEHLAEWLSRGYAGEMSYLADPRRANPQLAMPEARSVIVCALNYNADLPYSIHAAAQSTDNRVARGWLARYAWGDDYHGVIGEKLNALVDVLRARFGADFLARPYVDTGPVIERAVARDAGLGWLGKNTCLINETIGSWLFLGVILTSLELPPATGLPAQPPTAGLPAMAGVPDLCGNCTLCLDACPTGALVEPYVLDARRCISYLTIELRGSIPGDLRSAIGWQVFGCDICQDVCPWNRTAPATPVAALQPRDNLFAPDLAWLLSLTREQFSATFRNSAVKRTKWRGLLRNACIAAGNAAAAASPSEREQLHAQLAPRLEELAADRVAGSDRDRSIEDDLLAEHARWALARLK